MHRGVTGLLKILNACLKASLCACGIVFRLQQVIVVDTGLTASDVRCLRSGQSSAAAIVISAGIASVIGIMRSDPEQQAKSAANRLRYEVFSAVFCIFQSEMREDRIKKLNNRSVYRLFSIFCFVDF